MLIGDVINFERQYKNRLAGMRTYILVCMGAAIIVLIQVEIVASALEDAMNHPELSGVICSDQARLIHLKE